jgi:hypothetical protein
MPELPEGYQRLGDSERHAVTGARLVGPADQAEALTVTIALRRKPGAPELPDEQHWADTPPAERTYLSPVLYALGGTPVFRDIDDGGSNAAGGAPGYTAGPGWDACTGWGSLNGHALLHALRHHRHHDEP